MKVRHRLNGAILLLGMGLTLAAGPAGARPARVPEVPLLSRAWEWLVGAWGAELRGGRGLSRVVAKEGMGVDPNGNPGTAATTTNGGVVSAGGGDEGLGLDPNGGH